MTDGHSIGSGRRLVALLAVAGGVVAIAVVAPHPGPGADPAPPVASPSEATGSTGGWTELPTSPLSARTSATAIWVDSMVVIVGGDDSRPCPPNADCVGPAQKLSDGASYDPATETWTVIAPSPVPIGRAETAVVGDIAYFWVADLLHRNPSFLAYDVAADRWHVLPLPPAIPNASLRLAAATGAVVAYVSTNEFGDRGDRLFDVAAGTWRELPPEPLTPSFDRTLVAVDDRLVLIAVENLPNPGVRPPIYRCAVLDLVSGEWRRLADAPIVGSDPVWFAAGGLVVNPTLGGGDGGEVNNWGRMFPLGGMLDLDGEAWVGLPNPPPEGPSFAGNPVGGDRIVVNRQGWAIDVERLGWERVGEPVGGPQEGAATAWAGDWLIMFGGARFEGMKGTLLRSAWEWRPGDR